MLGGVGVCRCETRRADDKKSKQQSEQYRSQNLKLLHYANNFDQPSGQKSCCQSRVDRFQVTIGPFSTEILMRHHPCCGAWHGVHEQCLPVDLDDSIQLWFGAQSRQSLLAEALLLISGWSSRFLMRKTRMGWLPQADGPTRAVPIP